MQPISSRSLIMLHVLHEISVKHSICSWSRPLNEEKEWMGGVHILTIRHNIHAAVVCLTSKVAGNKGLPAPSAHFPAPLIHKTGIPASTRLLSAVFSMVLNCFSSFECVRY